jgi:hypothetical protein
MTDPKGIACDCGSTSRRVLESRRAITAQRTPETCLILAAVLETMRREGVTGDDLPACIDRLKRSAAPGRVAS